MRESSVCLHASCGRYARGTIKGMYTGGRREIHLPGNVEDTVAENEEERPDDRVVTREEKGLEGLRTREKRHAEEGGQKLSRGCERGACADETRSGTCGPHRSEPVREPHTSALFNLSTWMPQPTLSIAPPFSPRHVLPVVSSQSVLVAASSFEH